MSLSEPPTNILEYQSESIKIIVLHTFITYQTDRGEHKQKNLATFAIRGNAWFIMECNIIISGICWGGVEGVRSNEAKNRTQVWRALLLTQLSARTSTA